MARTAYRSLSGRATSNSPRVVALRALALRRLTEAQLWSKLERKGFPHDAIAEAVASCKRDGYLDDRLYAELYIVGARKAVGDARLVAALVRRGIDRETAQRSIENAPHNERGRCRLAFESLERKRPDLAYPSAARALERLGFPASVIYATLRERVASAE